MNNFQIQFYTITIKDINNWVFKAVNHPSGRKFTKNEQYLTNNTRLILEVRFTVNFNLEYWTIF